VETTMIEVRDSLIDLLNSQGLCEATYVALSLIAH
jgi:hypothetical protein